MNSELAPIVIFAYNRVDHLKATIDHLKKNELASESNLYIYSDAAKSSEDLEKVTEVKNYFKTINGFKSLKIIEREKKLEFIKTNYRRHGDYILSKDIFL